MSSLQEINRTLEKEAPAVSQALSRLGRAAEYPPDIPFQASQARGKRYNATIGQITDGKGQVLALPTIERTLASFEPEDLSRALLYSPIDGLAELRERWCDWERPEGAPPSSLPLVTVGLTHALSLVADMFSDPGRKVLVPAPYWGNYRQIFGLRTGAEIVPVPIYRDRVWQPMAIAEALSELPADEPALCVLNLPSNPGGFSPNAEQRRKLVELLVRAAERRPLVVVCDDAYSGLVYEPGIPSGSLFWELIALHERLIPVRTSGATKEFVLFGGRVGFLTLPFPRESPVAAVLENKLRCLLRAGVGSPVALTQSVLLQALRDGSIRDQVAAVVKRLETRYRALRDALAEAESRTDLFRSLPFNSGAFALLELADGLEAEAARLHLLENHDTGVVAISPNYLRLAFCSVRSSDMRQLVSRVEAGLREIRP